MPTYKPFFDRCTGVSILVALACLLLPLVAANAGGDFSPAKPSAPVELRLPDLAGRDMDLAKFRGKVVLVNFWASWCAPCIAEMPGIQRLANEMRGRPFAVIGVNLGEARLRVKTMVRRLGIEFPVLLDMNNDVFNRWGATVLPTTYVLDGKGVIRYLGRGPLEWDGDEVREVLDALLEGETALGSVSQATTSSGTATGPRERGQGP